MKSKAVFAGLAALFVAVLVQAPQASAADAALAAAIAGPQRTEAYSARDVYRHPAETLAFFGIAPTMTVVEISPGGGWYTEILAPYLRESGKLYAAAYPKDPSVEYYTKSRTAFEAKLAAAPGVYDRVVVTDFAPPAKLDIAPAGSADLVVTFRNVHNWLKDSNDEKVFAAAFRALKAGGVLGVVEHRAKPGTTREQSLDSGYTDEAVVIASAQKAGFVLEGKERGQRQPERHP